MYNGPATNKSLGVRLMNKYHLSAISCVCDGGGYGTVRAL